MLAWTAALAVTAGTGVVAVPAAVAAGTRGPGAPTALSVDGVTKPVGVDPDGIELAWRVVDPRKDARQTAYRILVASRATTDPRSSAVVWDSRAVAASEQAFVAYGGPGLAADTDYWWTVSTTDAGGRAGPFATPQHFVTGLRTVDWRAQWVRPGPAAPGNEDYTYVRTTAKLAASPIVRATAYVAAAHKYQLWVNGTRADSGPAFSYPEEQYVQATDVTRLLKPGASNALGVLHHWYGAGQGRPESAPGLLVQVTVVHRDGTREVVGTDGSWREHAAEWMPAPSRNEEGDDVEHVDGRASPLGWATASYDDRAWTAIAVLGPVGTAPFTHLVTQRTRIEEQPVTPVNVRTLRDGAVVADLGAVVAATPTVTFRHGRAGRLVKLHVGYLLDPDGHVSTTRGTQGTDLSYQYTQRAGAQTFHPFNYLAFRYVEVDAPGEPLGRNQLVAYARHTAMPDTPGSTATFASSNPTLDAVWRLMQHSALYSAQEQFLDTPTREKGQFLADAFNESQATMRAFGEQNLTRQALIDFADSQARYWPDGRVNAVYPNGDGKRDIPDFTEMYPEWVWQYYQSTGDRATVVALLPVVERIADYVSRAVDPATGLVTRLPGGDGDYLYGIVDWPPQMRYGYDVKTVARTTENALAVDVFMKASALERALGDPATANVEAGRGGTLAAAMNTKLRRPGGVFVDGLEADGEQSPHASQQANALALAYGVDLAATVPPGAAGPYVAAHGIATGPMNGIPLLRSLHVSGLDADVVRLLTDRKDPGWAHIVATGGTFTWEDWTPSDALGDSMSHGWGSGALVAVQEAVLGVKPSLPPDSLPGPGVVLDVHAPSAGPSRVTGRVPTVAGPFDVAWHRAGRRVTLRLVVPPNAGAVVTLPGKAAVTVGAGTYAFRSAG